MKIKRHPVLLAVYLIFTKDDKVLLLRRENSGFEDGNYSLVAGHVNKNESAIQGAIREGLEEAGVVLKPQNLELVHVMSRLSETERIDLFFKVNDWEGVLKIMSLYTAAILAGFRCQTFLKI
jgi:8-oxo-dGTP diphosphatase